MNPTLYDLLLVVLSALLSWFITHKYYLISLNNQEEENKKEREALIKALQEQNENDATLLTQQYIDASVKEWKKQGTAEHYLNSLEIPNEEKAKIFQAACLRHKKRQPKRNPYAVYLQNT